MGAPAGTMLRIQCVGDFVGTSGGPDNVTSLIAVFNGSDTLLDKSEAHRVPDAIEAGNDHVTVVTWPGNEATDIDEDFFAQDVTLEVPCAARPRTRSPAWWSGSPTSVLTSRAACWSRTRT